MSVFHSCLPVAAGRCRKKENNPKPWRHRTGTLCPLTRRCFLKMSRPLPQLIRPTPPSGDDIPPSHYARSTTPVAVRVIRSTSRTRRANGNRTRTCNFVSKTPSTGHCGWPTLARPWQNGRRARAAPVRVPTAARDRQRHGHGTGFTAEHPAAKRDVDGAECSTTLPSTTLPTDSFGW